MSMTSNNSMQLTALRAAADAERWSHNYTMRAFRASAMLALLIVGNGANAQSATGIRGTIRFESDSALAGAIVLTTVDRAIRAARTDSVGKFGLDLPPGTYALEVLCPALAFSFATPIALRRTVRVVDGNVDVTDTVPQAACVPIPPRTVRVRWQGWYSAAFEESSFRPCATDTIARELQSYGHPFGRHAWVAVAVDAWRVTLLDGLPTNRGTGRVTGFVEWAGVVRGPAPAGHLGVANYAITVDSIFAVAATGRCP